MGGGENSGVLRFFREGLGFFLEGLGFFLEG